MAKASKEIQKPSENTDIALPSYAGQIEGTKSQAAANNRPRPRIKVVQQMTSSDLKKSYGEGAVLLAPDNLLVASPGEQFVAIPLFLYETYELHRDIKDNEGGSLVLESSTNPASPLAKLCTLADRDLRVRQYDKFTAQAFHMFNAVLLIDEGPHKGAVAVASWKIRGGGSKSGRNFAGMIARREDQKVWCYMSRVAFSTELVEFAGNEWWTINAANPDKDPFVAKDRLEFLKDQHDVLGRLHATEGIAVAAETDQESGLPA